MHVLCVRVLLCIFHVRHLFIVILKVDVGTVLRFGVRKILSLLSNQRWMDMSKCCPSCMQTTWTCRGWRRWLWSWRMQFFSNKSQWIRVEWMETSFMDEDLGRALRGMYGSHCVSAQLGEWHAANKKATLILASSSHMSVNRIATHLFNVALF